MSLHVMPSLFIIGFSVSLFVCMGISAEAGALSDQQTNGASGLITGVTGAPITGGSGASRVLSLGDTLSRAEELRTNPDDTVEILWDRQAVIQVHPKSHIMIQETKPGETEVHLTGGSVRVALAYGSRPSDMVTVHTPTSRVFTRGGIVEVDVLPSAPTLLSRMSAVFAGADSAAALSLVESVRVLEGQAGVEPLKATRPSQMLEAGLQARVAAGAIEQTSGLPASAGKGVGLAATDRRQATPGPLTQNIVRVHVSHALEVERLMNTTPSSLDEAAKAGGTDIRGAIVSTSLGVPTTSFAQSSGSAGGSSPTPTVSTPLPTLPPIQTPTLTTLAPNQSGGVNSRSLINSVLSDGKNRDNGKGKGKNH